MGQMNHCSDSTMLHVFDGRVIIGTGSLGAISVLMHILAPFYGTLCERSQCCGRTSKVQHISFSSYNLHRWPNRLIECGLCVSCSKNLKKAYVGTSFYL